MGLENDEAFQKFVDQTRKENFSIILDHNGGAARTIMADIHKRFGLIVEEIGGELGVSEHRIERKAKR